MTEQQHLQVEGQPSMESSSQSTDAEYKQQCTTNYPTSQPKQKQKQKKTSPRRTFKSKQQQQQQQQSSFADTVAGMQKVASETYHTLQEWAATQQSPTTDDDVSHHVVTPCGDVTSSATPCGVNASRRPNSNEPKASIKLFSYAEMTNPEIGAVDGGNAKKANTSKAMPMPMPMRASASLHGFGFDDNVSNVTEEETKASSAGDTGSISLESSLLRRLTACTGGGIPNLSEVKLAIGQARAAWDLSEVKEAVGGAGRAAVACSGQRKYKYDTDLHNPVSSGASVDESIDSEAMQVRRLTSWGTIGTADTSYSEATLGMLEHSVDDDGNPIDKKLWEKMMSGKRQSQQRKRTVKFEYPPISSVRECPRHNLEDLPMLFFTEEELYQIEDDRECTEIADDVEVVAVSSSITTYDSPVSPSVSVESAKSKQSFQSSPSSGTSPAASPPNKFTTHVPTPRMWSKRKGTYFSFSQSEDPKSSRSHKNSVQQTSDSYRGRAAQRDDSNNPRKRAGTPRRGAEPEPAEDEDVSDGIAKTDEPRLIKSVQIYLRERSTNPKSPSSCSR